MGVVYHSNYFVWFDQARTEYMRSLGLSYRRVEELGIMLPVAEVSCRYFVPCHYDDELEVTIKLTALGAASINFEYDVYRPADDKLLAHGNTKQAFVSKDLHPVNGKRRFPVFWELLQSELLEK